MKFAVLYYIEGKWWATVEDEYGVFNRMAMDDCYDIEITDIRMIDEEEFCEPCEFYGTWHDLYDPLRMEIQRKRDGKVIAARYAPDH